MRLLLDTHAFLWFVLNDPSLTPTAKGLIADPANNVLLSPASYWEIAIKVSLGKYSVPGSFETFFNNQIAINGFAILPITVAHASTVTALPFHHRDPFDRMLIGQALTEKIDIVGNDVRFDAYGVVRHW